METVIPERPALMVGAQEAVRQEAVAMETVIAILARLVSTVGVQVELSWVVPATVMAIAKLAKSVLTAGAVKF